MNVPHDSSPEELDAIADRATRAAAAGRANRTAQEEKDKAAAAAAAAAQSAQTAAAAAQAATAAVGVLPSPAAPAFAVPPPAQPPAPPPVVANNPSGKKGGKGNNTVAWLAFGLVCMLTLFVLVLYLKGGNTTVSEGWQTLFANLSTRLDRTFEQGVNTAAGLASLQGDVKEMKPVLAKATQDIITLAAAPKCDTCNGSATGNTGSPSKGSSSGGAKGGNTPKHTSTKPARAAVATPVVTMHEERRETRTDGRCVIELSEPNGAKVYVRLDTAKANGNLTAAKVDDKKGDWNQSNPLSYVGDGAQTVHLDGTPSCKAATQAFTSSRAFPWTSTRIGVNGCKPGPMV